MLLVYANPLLAKRLPGFPGGDDLATESSDWDLCHLQFVLEEQNCV